MEKSSFNSFNNNERQLTYSIEKTENMNLLEKHFILSNDQYQLFWILNDRYSFKNESKELGPKDMADLIWNEALESIGIF